MLSERQNKILKLIVERYIKEPIPVGSKAVSKILKCSSATVRNDMGELENQGLLEKTHTSSGRIPSEAGYRYYVDNLMELKKMNAEDMLKLQIVFKNQQLALSDVITKSLQVISDMTNYTAVVLGSTSHENLLKQIEVVPIDDVSMIVIIVTDKGHVEHKNIKLNDVSIDEVKKTVGLINNLISGTPIDEVSRKLEFEVKPIIGKYVKQHEQIYNAFYHVFSDFTNQEVNIMGRSKMLEQPEFSSNIEKIKTVFNKLDSPELINNIVEDDDNNIKVYIGNENNIDSDVTVIQTKYKNGGEEGTIAIIGPKRMLYSKVISQIDFVKKKLNEEMRRFT